MKELILLVLLCVLPRFVTAQVHYQSYNTTEALSSAQYSGKYILVSFEASWCQPCQWMKKNIYSNDFIANKINSEFTPIRSDMTNPTDWSESYDVNVLPYVMILDSYGNKIADLSGTSTISEFGTFLDCKCQVKAPPQAKPVYASMVNNESSPADRYWTVQIGKYVGPFYANKLKSKADKSFEDVHVLYERDKNGKDIYRVFVGLFVDENTAKYTLDILRSQGYKGFTKYL